MTIDEKGNIVEATRTEVVRHYLFGDLKDIFTLDEYIALLKYRGAKIIESKGSESNA